MFVVGWRMALGRQNSDFIIQEKFCTILPTWNNQLPEYQFISHNIKI